MAGPTCCQIYCLGLSAFSTVFLFYLGLMIAVGSETIYIEVHSHAGSAVALFISALVYAAITAYVYYNTFMNVDRKEELRRWIRERNQRGTEMALVNQSRLSGARDREREMMDRSRQDSNF